jgi:transposase-like protein
MQDTETTKRHYRTKSQKLQLLNELDSGGMNISTLARKYGIHPVTNGVRVGISTTTFGTSEEMSHPILIIWLRS